MSVWPGPVIDVAAARPVVDDLCAALRAARVDAEVSTREAADRAGVNLGTLWRLESARSAPTWPTFARLANVAGVRVELDDGQNRPRTLGPDDVALPPGYRPAPLVLAQNHPDPFAAVLSHRDLVRLGAQLWWARLHDTRPEAAAVDVQRALDMSPHTVANIEFAAGWPSLVSLVRMATLLAHTVVLVPVGQPQAAPRWPMPTG